YCISTNLRSLNLELLKNFGQLWHQLWQLVVSVLLHQLRCQTKINLLSYGTVLQKLSTSLALKLKTVSGLMDLNRSLLILAKYRGVTKNGRKMNVQKLAM